MKTLKLSEATRPQLLAYARDTLGISDVNTQTRVEELRAKISACGHDEVTVEEKEVLPAPISKEQVETTGRKKVKVLIATSEQAGGDKPVPLGFEGRVMLVPRGEVVEIPVEYFESLKNAVMDHYEPQRDGSFSETPRQVPAYPYQVFA